MALWRGGVLRVGDERSGGGAKTALPNQHGKWGRVSLHGHRAFVKAIQKSHARGREDGGGLWRCDLILQLSEASREVGGKSLEGMLYRCLDMCNTFGCQS